MTICHKTLLLVVLVLIPRAVVAEDVVLVGLSEGVHYLRVEVGPDGVRKAEKLTTVRVSPRLPDAPPVSPPVEGVAAVALQEALKVGNPTEAAVLQATYQAIANQVRSGDLSVSDAATDTKRAVDLVLSSLGNGAPNRWKPFRKALFTYLSAQGLSSPSDFADAYQGIADGLAGATNGSDAIDVGAILKLVAAIVTKNPILIAEAVTELLQSLRR